MVWAYSKRPKPESSEAYPRISVDAMSLSGGAMG